jgi:hypothetical protein
MRSAGAVDESGHCPGAALSPRHGRPGA